MVIIKSFEIGFLKHLFALFLTHANAVIGDRAVQFFGGGFRRDRNHQPWMIVFASIDNYLV